ncbi:cytochrome P450 [Streptomyces sp. WAC06614]|uniref:cytochrome P450 n=1 Tax=Streptomyces sp. WAC06614 TaxID=2487416 RepID=UPI000F7A7432|nr:cytochrome P450 [Streptomyces sp. WAC06614]RSS81245.1 cytochrome P450 [Streptomyces sp. WAC06614]
MSPSLLHRILDHDNRADPYPLYAELHRTPVLQEDGGPYVIGGFQDIERLLNDPRISSDVRNLAVGPASDGPLVEAAEGGPEAGADGGDGTDGAGMLPPAFLRLDPPDHDRLRRITNRPFGPPHSPHRIEDLRGELLTVVDGLIDGIARDGDPGNIDLVGAFAYPFPVTVICRVLGVPREDEARFHAWADVLAASLDPDPDAPDPRARLRASHDARLALGGYLAELIEERRRHPGDDMISQLAAGDGPDGTMSTMELLATTALLLVAGHETTVNLITNGMLTLLRHPWALDRLRQDPAFAVPLVEELLRYEPPVQLLPQRTPLTDIEVHGTVVPRGSSMWLVLAAGNRDPEQFADPDRFDPDRKGLRHLGLGSGIHGCFGAPLARLEAQLALSRLAARLEGPRLLADPPPYRRNAVLRGPRSLPVACSGIRP